VRTTDSRYPVELLARLVAARSPNPPGDERAVAAVIQADAASLGFPPARVVARTPNRPNLVFTLARGAPTLILAAHMDTMPPGNIASWRTDPYRLAEIDDRLVGLGAADMKGAVAATLVAAARWASSPDAAGCLTLAFTADEENGSAYGMKWLAREGLLVGDAAVVTEPSSVGQNSWEKFFVAQRGSCVCWLTARGEPGHSGALVPRGHRSSAPFAKALAALVDADLFSGLCHPVDGTPVTVNLATMVEGGMVPFAHPESLRAAVEVRTLEGMTEELVLSELRRVIAEAGLSDRVEIEPAPPPANWLDPGVAVHDERLLGAARRAWTEVIGSLPDPSVMTATTDSTWLNAAGIPALPAFGPGSLGVAHKPNEWILMEDFLRAVDLFEALIRQYFGQSE
jgi:succinyl-diaminopimelate desuccinylase